MELDNIEAVKQGSKNGFFPKEIVYANKVMNIVTSMHFKEIYGIDLIKEYHPTKQEYNHAKDLYDEFKAYLDTYKPGDEYEMIEYFVESFNMEDLIEIKDENLVTSGMKADLSLKGDLQDLADDALSAEDVDVANADFALKHQDGANPAETMMMSMYMLGAMEFLILLNNEMCIALLWKSRWWVLQVFIPKRNIPLSRFLIRSLEAMNYWPIIMLVGHVLSLTNSMIWAYLSLRHMNRLCSCIILSIRSHE
jgi:hypothetical protein